MCFLSRVSFGLRPQALTECLEPDETCIVFKERTQMSVNELVDDINESVLLHNM